MLRIMAHHLEQAKLPYAIIEGSVSARKRMTLVDEFNRNPIKPKVLYGVWLSVLYFRNGFNFSMVCKLYAVIGTLKAYMLEVSWPKICHEPKP